MRPVALLVACAVVVAADRLAQADGPTLRAAPAGQAWIGAGSMTPEALSAAGYSETEYFLSGTAQAYGKAGEWTADGSWSVKPTTTAPFTTRMLVRRPDDNKFNGIVVVEWNNVSGGNDGGVDFNYMKEEILRGGYVWVGVSAQEVGVTRLKQVAASRYASLSHPGDAYSYDIFSQAARAIRTRKDIDPIGMKFTKVIAVGRSQSAGRLVTYIDAVHPRDTLYDGYLVHSRGGGAAPLSVPPEGAVPPDTRFRTDLNVPILVVQAEGDVRSSYPARQPATGRYRSWEMAGTSHAGIRDGSETARYVIEVPPPLEFGPGCKLPINVAPHNAVTKAALHAMARWVKDGVVPPQPAEIEINARQPDPIARDRYGMAKGGIRLPEVEVPTATVDGRVNEVAKPTSPPTQNFCSLYGSTTTFDAVTLKALYPTHDAFVAKFVRAVDGIVKQGYWLGPEAVEAKEAARHSTIGR